MAEAIAKKWLEQHNKTNVSVQSAGIEAVPGWFAAQHAVTVCNPYLDDHEAQNVSEKILQNADVVFTMGLTHMNYLIGTYPQEAGKVFPLALNGTPVEDPFGRDLAEYVRIHAVIESYVHQRMRELFMGELLS